MRKKIFRGKTMAEVVEIVKKEMGKDAIIVSSRQVPLGPVWKVWQSPGIEVIAIAKGSNKDNHTAERRSQRDSPPTPVVDKKSAEKPAEYNTPSTPAEDILKEPPREPLPDPLPEPLVEEQHPEPHTEVPVEKENEEPDAPVKKMSPTGSKAVSLRAFQAALRRSSSPQKRDDISEPAADSLKDETAAPPLPGGLKEDTAAAIDTPQKEEYIEAAEEFQTDDLPKSPPQEYPPLSLDTPKPKLALDDFAQALNPAAKQEGKNAFVDFLREKGFISPLPPAETDTPPSPPADQIRLSKTEKTSAPDVPERTPPSVEDRRESVPPPHKPSQPTKPKTRIRLTHPLSGMPASQTPFGFPKTVDTLRKLLIDQGVDNAIVDKLTFSCAESLSPQTLSNIELVQDHIAKQMLGHLHVLSPSQTENQRIIIAVGASGAGKTNLIAKLAARAVKNRKLETVWISADTVRTGAIAEARVYADLIGIPLLLAYTPEELARTVKDCAAYPLILVDSPASNPWRETSMVELGELLHAVHSRTTYLTVPATSKDADLLQIQAGYGVFKIDGLVFTKLDETRSLGSVFNLAWHSQIPLAYFTNGTRLLEDLHHAEAKTLVQAILGQHIGTG